MKRCPVVENSYYTNKEIKLMTPEDFRKRYSKKRLLSSSVILPSQHHSYSLCMEFMKEWFLSKFSSEYFTHVHIDGKLAFDDFRSFEKVDEKIKRVNPILAIIPSIESEYNRDWIDSNAEGPLQSLRRTRLEGKFFSDVDKETYIAVQFKSIKMNFTYKMRVNTRAEQLDLLEFVKTNHHAGYTENNVIPLDIHVPKQIIAQVAHDIGLEVDDNLNVKEPYRLLQYLNAHSVLPFMYKFRCVNGNHEFFIKLKDGSVHLKMDLPTKDDGDRVGMDLTNFTVEFNVETEMIAPMNFIYYSMHRQDYISNNTVCKDNIITVARFIATDIADKNPDGWELFSTTEYLIETEDLHKPELSINLGDYLYGTDLAKVLQYTVDNKINPAVFLDFNFYMNGVKKRYVVDWDNLVIRIFGPIDNLTTVIAVYIDKKYVNDVLINLENMEGSRI